MAGTTVKGLLGTTGDCKLRLVAAGDHGVYEEYLGMAEDCIGRW